NMKNARDLDAEDPANSGPPDAYSRKIRTRGIATDHHVGSHLDKGSQLPAGTAATRACRRRRRHGWTRCAIHSYEVPVRGIERAPGAGPNVCAGEPGTSFGSSGASLLTRPCGSRNRTRYRRT